MAQRKCNNTFYFLTLLRITKGHLKYLLFTALIVLLNGCSTYQQEVQKGLSQAQKGDWKDAQNTFTDVLDSKQDKLLYYLETGALAQNQGEYERSNELLSKADILSDTFFQENFKNRAWALLSNPRQGDYKGSGLERVYISYLKSLNYLALASQATTPIEKRKLQDAALVEARRIDNKLNEIKAQKTSYQDLDAKEDQAFYLKALDWLSGFYTRGDSEKYLYRDDAWARYMEGIEYEKSQDYDDARISYQDAAKLYESGYAKQYSLSNMTAERAWLDTIRMMREGGGWSNDDINKLIKEKLSPAMQDTLNSYQKGDGELIVLENEGFMPAKSELSLQLYGDPNSYSLVLAPFLANGDNQQNDAFRWFTMVYADINPLNLLANYKAGGAWGAFGGVFTKRVILGRAGWDQLERAHLDTLLTQQFIRVTVPYYSRFTLDDHTPSITLNGQEEKQTNSIRMTSLADIAMQEQLSEAQRDIYESLVRELLRSWLANRIANSVHDNTAKAILSLIGQVTQLATSAADTRNWLMLPAQIRLTRIPLKPGEYTPNYKINNKDFSHAKIVLKPNDIKVWNLRNPN